jgi:hypothetical protein
MEGRSKPRMDQCKRITNDLCYDASGRLTSLPIRQLENLLRPFLLHIVYVLMISMGIMNMRNVWSPRNIFPDYSQK